MHLGVSQATAFVTKQKQTNGLSLLHERKKGTQWVPKNSPKEVMEAKEFGGWAQNSVPILSYSGLESYRGFYNETIPFRTAGNC